MKTTHQSLSMKKNICLILVIAICAVLTSSCMKGNEVNQEIVELSDIKIDDGKKNEVVMTDSDTEKRLPPVPTFGEMKEGTTYVDKDGSSVRISYDGQGNRIETRNFFNHPNLKMLTVTISNDGTIKEGIVFGHNNEKKKLPPDLIDNALTTSGNDIAYKVGITTTKNTSSPTKAQPNQVYSQQTPVYTNIPDPRRQPVYTQPQPQTEPELTQQEEQPQSTPPPAENPTTEQKPTIAQDKKKKNEGEN